MHWLFHFDETDPLDRSYRRYLRKMWTWCLIVLVLVAITLVIGVPHLQTSYRYTGPTPQGGSPSAEQKLDAWYISVTGWQHVRRGQYGHDGCPYILFVPAGDCID